MEDEWLSYGVVVVASSAEVLLASMMTVRVEVAVSPA
jgi:hypothetical protein